MLARENPFWQFSLAIYAAEGVAAECLTLQNTLNVDVNALLFCAWLGSARNVELTDINFAAIDTHIESWRETVVRPMRSIRQGIKTMPAMADEAVKELRGDIARLELRAEQIEQAMLFGLASELFPHPFAAAAAAPSAAIAHNVTAFIARHLAAQCRTEPPCADCLVAAAVAYRPA